MNPLIESLFKRTANLPERLVPTASDQALADAIKPSQKFGSDANSQLLDFLYSGKNTARDDVYYSAMQQGAFPSRLQQAGVEMIGERFQPGSMADVNLYQMQNRRTAYIPETRAINYSQNPNDGTPFLRDFGEPMVMNHEIEHARSVPAEINSEKMSDMDLRDELPTVMGDIVFMGEQANRAIGKPLQHQVTYPSGKSNDIQWMVDQAKQHGYFNGTRMVDLLGGQAGQSYLKQMLGQ